jgi:ribonuclease HII
MGWSDMTVKDIKARIEGASPEEYPGLILELLEDERSGIRALAKSLEQRLKNRTMEEARLLGMKQMEAEFRGKGYRIIAGMDEVGRGPLAGPVVSCAIVLPEGSLIEKVNDSKKLSPSTREALYDQLMGEALSVGIGVVDHQEIDTINILQATKKSMMLAIQQLALTPELVLVDAVDLPGLKMAQRAIIKGDARCYSIAAASVVAKVYRDRLMEAYHEQYPMYQFGSNKGYGSQEHVDAIRTYGLSPIHRRSFCSNFVGW